MTKLPVSYTHLDVYKRQEGAVSRNAGLFAGSGDALVLLGALTTAGVVVVFGVVAALSLAGLSLFMAYNPKPTSKPIAIPPSIQPIPYWLKVLSEAACFLKSLVIAVILKFAVSASIAKT